MRNAELYAGEHVAENGCWIVSAAAVELALDRTVECGYPYMAYGCPTCSD